MAPAHPLALAAAMQRAGAAETFADRTIAVVGHSDGVPLLVGLLLPCSVGSSAPWRPLIASPLAVWPAAELDRSPRPVRLTLAVVAVAP